MPKSTPLAPSSSSLRDLVQRLQGLPDEALAPVLAVFTQQLGWVPGGRLDDLEEKASYRLTGILLGRATEAGFRHWCESFPLQGGAHLSGWSDELARARVTHTWSADDDAVSHHEHDQSALQCAAAVHNLTIARPWAMAAVVRQELALLAAHRTLLKPRFALGNEAERPPQMILDRVIRVWGVRLKHEAPTADPVPGRLEKSRQAFAKLTQAAWTQVEHVARLTGGTIDPAAFFGPTPSRQFPLAEQSVGWLDRPLARDGWDQAATMGGDTALAHRLIEQVHHLDPAAQPLVLLRWFDAAAKQGALPILDLLSRQTSVLDTPVVPEVFTHAHLIRGGERLREHIQHVHQQAHHTWNPQALAFLVSQQRHLDLGQVAPAPSPARRRRT